MAGIGFCGPSYASGAQPADAQVCRNFYLEKNESGTSNSPYILLRTPGLLSRYALTDGPGRGIFTITGPTFPSGRTFAVSGSTLYELNSDFTATFRGTVANDGLMVSMAASNTQLLIASGGHGYVLTLATNALTTDPANLVSPLIVGYADGYFASLQANSNKWQISTLLDATTWSGLNVTAISVFPDNLVSMICTDHREVVLFGKKQSVVYYDSGNTFPFDVVPSGIMEVGCAAQFSPAKLDNTTYFLAGDERGFGQAMKLSGYTPVRISNHAVEYAWNQYSTIADAVGWAYQEEGHTFYVLYFPTANKTWVFDAATGQWHERDRLQAGASIAYPGVSHAMAFGRHLIQDWGSGTVYQQARSLFDDNGAAIRRVRRAPYVQNELTRVYHSKLEVFLKSGVGPQPPLANGDGTARGPQVMMRFSDDGANTWSNERVRDAGQAGNFKTRLQWLQLGQSRNRAYEIAVSDAVDWQIVDAYLTATGYDVTERLSDKLKKMA